MFIVAQYRALSPSFGVGPIIHNGNTVFAVQESNPGQPVYPVMTNTDFTTTSSYAILDNTTIPNANTPFIYNASFSSRVNGNDFVHSPFVGSNLSLGESAQINAAQAVLIPNNPSLIMGAVDIVGQNHAFKGSISEIIIYDRVLKKSEKSDIENYLSKKWGIKIIKPIPPN